MLTEQEKLIWYKIIFSLKGDLGKKPDLNGVLYLIGINELGKVKPFSKEEKMDLMHVATCKLLSQEGYYELDHYDSDGWPHFTMLKPPPFYELIQQEAWLKHLIVRYYTENGLLPDE